MDAIEALQTLSEATITFTGLAGLVSVLASSSLHPDMRDWRVRNMILCSLMAFFCSLVPQGMLLFGMSAESAWRWSSAILMTGQLTQVAFASLSMRAPDMDLFRPLWLVIFFLAGTALVCYAHLGNLLPSWGDPGPAPVFVGICWLMVLATVHFFVLVMSRESHAEPSHSAAQTGTPSAPPEPTRAAV